MKKMVPAWFLRSGGRGGPVGPVRPVRPMPPFPAFPANDSSDQGDPNSLAVKSFQPKNAFDCDSGGLWACIVFYSVFSEMV